MIAEEDVKQLQLAVMESLEDSIEHAEHRIDDLAAKLRLVRETASQVVHFAERYQQGTTVTLDVVFSCIWSLRQSLFATAGCKCTQCERLAALSA